MYVRMYYIIAFSYEVDTITSGNLGVYVTLVLNHHMVKFQIEKDEKEKYKNKNDQNGINVVQSY